MSCRLGVLDHPRPTNRHPHLYPRLSVGGILIIDDYGAFLGAQTATDQYFSENGVPVFLSCINESVRLLVKPARQPA
jgi:hypothetical protein